MRTTYIYIYQENQEENIYIVQVIAVSTVLGRDIFAERKNPGHGFAHKNKLDVDMFLLILHASSLLPSNRHVG